MAIETVIEYIGTPIGIAVVLAYGVKLMYKHFTSEVVDLKSIIEKKDELIERMNKEHLISVSEMIENNTKINTQINEAITNFRKVIEKKLD